MAKLPKKTRRFKGERYTRTLSEDVDFFGIKKSAEYSGRKYRIIPSKRYNTRYNLWFISKLKK